MFLAIDFDTTRDIISTRVLREGAGGRDPHSYCNPSLRRGASVVDLEGDRSVKRHGCFDGIAPARSFATVVLSHIPL